MGDHDFLDWNTFGQSLLGSKTVANHLFDILAALDRVSGEVDSSLESGIECSLSSASSKDLSLDNELRCTRLQEVFTALNSLGFVFSHSESLDAETVLFHELLGCELLEIERSSACCGDLSEHFIQSEKVDVNFVLGYTFSASFVFHEV